MPTNPYQPSNETESAPRFGGLLTVMPRGALIGSFMLVLLGCAIAGIGMLPSDGPDFFYIVGAHLVASGIFGAISVWTCGQSWPRLLTRWIAVIVNATLAIRIAVLLFDGTVRGPLIVAVPVLLVLPALLNIVSAALGLSRAEDPKANV